MQLVLWLAIQLTLFVSYAVVFVVSLVSSQLTLLIVMQLALFVRYLVGFVVC